MKRTQKRLLIAAVVVVVAGIAVYAAVQYYSRPAPATQPTPPGGLGIVKSPPQPPGPATRPAGSQPANTTSAPATQAAHSQPATTSAPGVEGPAIESFSRGMALLDASKWLEARAELSAAFFSGKLTPAQQDVALRRLGDLADRTIFGPEMLSNDPYTFQYTFKQGEVLQKVERDLKLHVPSQMIVKINGLRSASDIRAGQSIKVINGPFHALVSKSKFTMDLYLQRDDQPRIFVKRLTVGLGKDGSTPVGLWRVALGKKLSHAPWNPPPSANLRTSIAWGQPGYPLGKEGYWLGLEGADEHTARFDGYGIHGTNEPESIGKAGSLGCIRLSDPDIDFVYSLLYEKWSTVEVRP